MGEVIRLRVASSEEAITLQSAAGSLAVEAVSPRVSFTKVEGGTRLDITDVDGTKSAILPDGAVGQDGVGIKRVWVNSDSALIVELTNDTVYMSGSIRGRDGFDGADGADGVTFTPSVSSDGYISWTNDGGRMNPLPVNIKGPQGVQGIPGVPGPRGDKGDPGPTYTFDDAPTANSNNPVTSGGIKSAFDRTTQDIQYFYGAAIDAVENAEVTLNGKLLQKQDALTFDNTPTALSDNPVKSSGIKSAIDAVANSIPTKVSDLTDDSGHYTKPAGGIPASDIASGVIPDISGKQDTLTFDSTPTANSTNPVTSGGIKSAIDAVVAEIETTGAEDAEAWAAGTRDGVDVPSTDPTYHNNAKYYAEQAFSGTPQGYSDLVNDVGDIKSALNVIPVSVMENAKTNYLPITYLHGTSINSVGIIVAGAGEVAYFNCVKGLTYKWNSTVRNRNYVCFYRNVPTTDSVSYDGSRSSVDANTEFTAPITGICAVFYHASTQTGTVQFWAVSNITAGTEDLPFMLKRTISKNLVGENSNEYYPVDIPAGLFYINVSTSDGNNFSNTLYIGLYDSQKNLVNTKITISTTYAYRDVQEITTTAIKYIKVEGTNAVPIMVTVNYNSVGGVVTYQPYFYDAESLTKQVHGILNADVPEYYKTHIESKISTINTLDNVDIRVGFITDEHYPNNGCHSPALLRCLWDNVPINFVVNNGDVLVQESTKALAMRKITEFNTQYDFTQNHYYPIIGNHEHNNANGSSTSTQLSLKQVQLAVLSKLKGIQFSGYASYYYDDSVTKCRYYFVGCRQNSGIYDEDLPWLLQSFKTTPEGYSIIVFSHIGLKYNSSYEITGVQTGIAVISMGLLAVANKGQYTYDHIPYNYSDVTAIPIAIFSGHVHFDGSYQYSNANYNGYIYTVATTCDAYGNQVVGSVDRTPETANEQAFDVISIDKTNRLITMTRIGGGSDRTFTYSSYGDL